MNSVASTAVRCPKQIIKKLDKIAQKNTEFKDQVSEFLRALNKKKQPLNELVDCCYTVALWTHKQNKLSVTELLVNFIIDQVPEYYPAYLIRTSIFEHKKNKREAFEDLKVYISFDASDITLVHRASDLALELNEENDAWQLLNHLLKIQPDNRDTLNKLGSLCYRQGKMQHAEQLFAHAVQLGTDDPAIINNYGATLEHNDKHKDAVVAFKAAIELNPRNVQYHNNLTHAYVDLEMFTEAKDSAENALRLDPNDGTSLFNRAVLYENDAEVEKARDFYERGLSQNPDLKHAYRNLSFVYYELGNYKKGQEYGLLGIQKFPNYLNIGVNLSFNFFMVDEWEKGYEYYGYRAIKNRIVDIKPWQGEDLSGKKLLIWNEQGIGDQYMFAWYFKQLESMNVECVIEVDRRLLKLMKSAFPKYRFVAEDSLSKEQLLAEKFDFMTVQATLGELFYEQVKTARHALIRDYHNLYTPCNGFMSSLKKYDQYWQNQVDAISNKPKIGICWRSGLVTAVRQRNFLAAEDMVDIFRDLDVEVINLQYGSTDDELDKLNNAEGLNFHHFENIDLKDDQNQLASLINAVDLVVSHSTAVHSLAGAIGVPTWNFLISHSLLEEPFVHPFAGMFPSVKYIETRDRFLKSVVPLVRENVSKWANAFESKKDA